MPRRDEEAISRFLGSHDVGDELAGVVDSIVSFGAFIKVADGVHGLLHVSEYREQPRLGSTIQVRIADIDRDARRMSLLPV